MSKKDYYNVLGVDRNADQATIKKKYRSLCKEKHPDVGGSEEEFKEIVEAYEVLSDSEKKSNYDRFGHSKPNQDYYKDMYNHFGFNKRQPMNKMGSNLRLNINLTLEEIFEGGNKKIRYSRVAPCMSCNSAGGSEPITCNTCGGNGILSQKTRTPFGIMENIITCHECQGDGVTYKNKCTPCDGHGTISKNEELEIKIPAGVQDGMNMVFQGMGQAVKNGTSGSLVVNFNEIPHKKYIRHNNDLKFKLTLPYHTLVLGGDVNIETIDGGEIKIKIPELNNVGDTLRVNGKGMKIMNSESRGDLLVNLDIEMPKEISDNDKKILEKLKNNYNKVVELEKS